MGEHIRQQANIRKRRRRRRELRNRSSGEGTIYRTRRRRYRFVILLLVLISVCCVLGFYGKPIAKLVAKAYLSLKISKSHLSGQEGAKARHSLARLSTDPNKRRKHADPGK